jgi:hypothetical protein
MKPQAVEVDAGKAYVYGIPDEDHDCDAMGCSSIAHVIAVVPLVDRQYRRLQSDGGSGHE